MTFRKLLLILSLTVTALIITLLSTSYAWYQFDNAVTDFNNIQTFSDEIKFPVIFTNNDVIRTQTGIPITEEQISTFAERKTFYMTPSKEGINTASFNVNYKISIINIKIDEELKNEYFKYKLVETINGVVSDEITGNFKNLSENFITLKEGTITKFDSQHSYELMIWLQESGDIQNSMQNKSITGNIKVTTILKAK